MNIFKIMTEEMHAAVENCSKTNYLCLEVEELGEINLVNMFNFMTY